MVSGPGQYPVEEARDPRGGFRDELCERRAIGDVMREHEVRRPPLEVADPLDRGLRPRIRDQAVHGLGRQDHDAAVTDRGDRFLDELGIRLVPDGRTSGAHARV